MGFSGKRRRRRRRPHLLAEVLAKLLQILGERHLGLRGLDDVDVLHPVLLYAARLFGHDVGGSRKRHGVVAVAERADPGLLDRRVRPNILRCYCAEVRPSPASLAEEELVEGLAALESLRAWRARSEILNRRQARLNFSQLSVPKKIQKISRLGAFHFQAVTPL
jgi:hypothetical protein